MTTPEAGMSATTKRCGKPLCVCERCAEAISDAHRAADVACGREWVCQCGSCMRVREIAMAQIDSGFARIKELEERLRIVSAVANGRPSE